MLQTLMVSLISCFPVLNVFDIGSVRLTDSNLFTHIYCSKNRDNLPQIIKSPKN